MYTPLLITSLLDLFLHTVNAHDITRREIHTPPPVTVYQFPNGTWVENLAVRASGPLLVTLLNIPELVQLDLSPSGRGHPTLVHSFAPSLGLLGITELEPDVFYTVVGDINLAALPSSTTDVPYAIWRVDVRPFVHLNGTVVSPARVTKVADIPHASLLNGIVVLNSVQKQLLIADSVRGVVGKLDVRSGNYTVVIDDPLLKANPPNAPFGVNGLKIRHNTLYFSNTAQQILARVPIHPDGKTNGTIEILARDVPVDDFELDAAGNAFLARNVQNELTELTATGKLISVAGNLNSSFLAGDTAVEFGRTIFDKDVLYVTTAGGQAAPVNGTFTEGGKVVAVHIQH